MAVFEEARQHTEREVVVKLLTTLAEKPETTQRDLATKMGISLGMMVSYMKSCVHKGLVRSKQVAPRRWAYFVTPKGFAEKSSMVSGYLYSSMTFFRDTRMQLEELFEDCNKRNIQNIAMIGSGDVSEIATLVSKGFAVSLTLIPTTADELKHAERNDAYFDKLKSFDAVLITDLINPQGTFDALKAFIAKDKLLSIATLCIARRRIHTTRQLEQAKETSS